MESLSQKSVEVLIKLFVYQNLYRLLICVDFDWKYGYGYY